MIRNKYIQEVKKIGGCRCVFSRAVKRRLCGYSCGDAMRGRDVCTGGVGE
jgi:hypothetical protein